MMMCCSWLLVPFLLLSGMATEIFGSRPGQCKTERAMTTQVQCSQDDDCSAPKKCCPTRGGGARCEIPATNCHQLTCSRCKIDTTSGFALCAVDGNWGSWGDYGTCSVTCGGGTQVRTRACDNPPPANDGNDCVGNNIETQICNTELCPVPGNWGSWNTGTCSVTCGGGTQVRTRACDNPPPAHCGNYCVGNNVETQICNAEPCPPTNPVACPNGWKEFNCHCYRVSNQGADYATAQAACHALNSNLAQIDSEEENTFVANLQLEYSGPAVTACSGADASGWIGLNDIQVEGTFRWGNTGSVPCYTNWIKSPPTPNYNRQENCVELFNGRHALWLFQWNDLTCTCNRAYVCEFRPCGPRHSGCTRNY